MSNFKIGDKVACIDNSYSQSMSLSEFYTVYAVHKGLLGVEDTNGNKYYYASRMFKHSNMNKENNDMKIRHSIEDAIMECLKWEDHETCDPYLPDLELTKEQIDYLSKNCLKE